MQQFAAWRLVVLYVTATVLAANFPILGTSPTFIIATIVVGLIGTVYDLSDLTDRYKHVP